MLSFSHVSVKTKTQQSFTSRCANLKSCMRSILLSSERTLAIMRDGIAGLCARLAASPDAIALAPLLLSLLPLSALPLRV